MQLENNPVIFPSILQQQSVVVLDHNTGQRILRSDCLILANNIHLGYLPNYDVALIVPAIDNNPHLRDRVRLYNEINYDAVLRCYRLGAGSFIFKVFQSDQEFGGRNEANCLSIANEPGHANIIVLDRWAVIDQINPPVTIVSTHLLKNNDGIAAVPVDSLCHIVAQYFTNDMPDSHIAVFIKRVFKQLVFGVQYLHSKKNMAHMNIAGYNLLACPDDYNPESDYFCKLIGFKNATIPPFIDVQDIDIRFTFGVNGFASLPPEFYQSELQINPYPSFKKDIWDMGMLLCFLLTCGRSINPAGPIYMSPWYRHLLEGTFVEHFSSACPYITEPWGMQGAIPLLAMMLHPNPAQRPAIEDIVQHPWFIAVVDELDALDVSDFLQDLGN